MRKIRKTFKDVDLVLFDKVIAFDHFGKRSFFIVNMPLDDGESDITKQLWS